MVQESLRPLSYYVNDLCRFPINDYGSSFIRMAKLKKKQGQKATKKPLTAFNLRLKVAREHAGLTQTELADRVKVIKQGGIDKLENRPARGSSYTVQIAHACNVSPRWLATGDEPMVRVEDVPEDAQAVGVAWSHLKGEAKDRYAAELLSVALPFLPATHPLYKTADKLYRDARKRRGVKEDLRGT